MVQLHMPPIIYKYVGRTITVPLQLFEFNLILWTTRKPVTSEMFWWCWWAPS